MLLNYPDAIDLFITHPTDTVDSNTYKNQLQMFGKCLELIEQYRNKKGYAKITSHIYKFAKFSGYMSSKGRKQIQTDVENAFLINPEDRNKWYIGDCEKYFVEYFVMTEESTHQSHQESNHFALTATRSPFIEQCKDVMLATYPQSEYGIKFNDQYQLNSYIPLDNEQVDLMCHCIGNIYKEKNERSTILGSDNFRTFLNFFGSKCGKAYAQPFSSLRHIYTMGK